MRPAAFLDRDGTLMEDRHYVRRPEDVVLLLGAASAVRKLNDAGIAAVVVTNQGGIARGIFDEAAYYAVRDRLDALLAAEGAHLDATYHCPHHPQFGGPCACRKPGTELHRRAIADLSLDPQRLAFIGDRWHDVVPATQLGGLGIIVMSPETPSDELERARTGTRVASSVGSAVEMVLAEWKLGK
jgi:D-glycero-D-manno-heptose 1,7-bisphosphate phosphatase